MENEKLHLPSLKVESGKFITIFEVGSIEHGIFATQEQLDDLKEAIKVATENDHSSIFVPAGLVKVSQYSL